jgi:D-aminopeptidase
MIADGARRAVERAAAKPAQVWEIAASTLEASGVSPGSELTVLRLPAISLPATLEVQMQTADMAEVASWVKGAERTGVRAVSISGEDPLAMFRSFVALTYITRVAEGR